MSQRTRTLYFVSAATALSLLGDQVLYSVLPVYYAKLGISAVQVGILLSANRWVRLLTNELAHRIDGGRGWFVAAFVLGSLTTAAYVFTQSFAVLLAARLLWGLAWSFIRQIGVTAIMFHTPVTSSGRSMGTYNGVSRLGSVAGLFGGAVLVDLVGFSPAMLVLAGLSLIAVPLAIAGFGGTRRSTATGVRAGVPWRFVVLGFVLGCVGPGLVMATLGKVLSAGNLVLDGFTAASLTGALLAVRFVLDIAVAPALGGLTDRHGLRRVGIGFFALGALALGLASAAHGIVPVSACVLVFFVAGTALHAGVGGRVAHLGSGAFARYVTAADFGAACGPMMGWLAIDWLGLPSMGMAIGAVFYGVCAVVLGLAPVGFGESGGSVDGAAGVGAGRDGAAHPNPGKVNVP